MYRIPPSLTPPFAPPPTDNRDDRHFLIQEEEAGSLRDYWVIILKYRWTIATFLLPIVLITGLSLQWSPRVYTAAASLHIENRFPNITGVSEGFAPAGSPADQYYPTQLNLLQSRSLAARVIQDLDLGQDPRFAMSAESFLSWVQSPVRQGMQSLLSWVREMSLVKWIQERLQQAAEREEPEEKGINQFELGVSPNLIDRYLSKLRIKFLDESQVAKIEFTSMSPSLSKEVVNAHMSAFIRTSLLTRFQLTGEARQFLEAKLAEAKGELERSEEELTRFRKVHAIVETEKGDSLVMERVKALNTDLTQARSRRIELESLYRTAQRRDARFLSHIVENPYIGQLKERISTFEIEKSRLATVYKLDHPSMAAVQEQIDQAKQRLDEEVHRILRSIESDYNAAKAREKALASELEEQRQSALALREKATAAAILEREVESNHALYENVLKRTKEADLTQTLPMSNLRVVDRADNPLQPDATKGTRTLFLSLMVGLLGGVGLAFLRHYLDNTLRTPEDIGRFLRLPTLGMVPDIRRLDTQLLGLGYAEKGRLTHRLLKSLTTEKVGPVRPHHPLSFVSESYQAICTALLFSLPERPPRTILITSAQAQEGKTATAVNIAVTLAQSGTPVLLIDADLRNGHCHRLLSMENANGLTHVLVGEGNASEFIKKTAITNLSLLSRGAIPPNPAPLLGSERMRQVLASLETDFSFIILDSAPILPITDSVILSTKVDGVLLVARAQAASRYVVRQACERLAYVRAKVLGVILNGIDMQSPEYKDYRNSYASYYAGYAGYATAPNSEGGKVVKDKLSPSERATD
jgi:succinoglycan biosynthesis transport protein ExoP